jgi:hypothetical protein
MNLDLLLKLRIAVGRCGEMDFSKWWNTRGQLGKLGSAAVRRGLPRTHLFAQARSVFAVAAHRCEEVFSLPGSVTLWHLDEQTEEAFDARWEHWLDHRSEWISFFDEVERHASPDLPKMLTNLGLAKESDLALIPKLRKEMDGRAVPLREPYSTTDDSAVMLAVGFACGDVGSLAIPYARAK